MGWITFKTVILKPPQESEGGDVVKRMPQTYEDVLTQ
jgi:hypothetical protein